MPSELNLECVCAGYGKRDVISQLSARFTCGHLSCILGPNGAGKSTLLRALCGYLQLRSGKLFFDTLDLDQLPLRQRAQLVAYVPQLAPGGLPFTVREAVTLARYPHLVSAPKPAPGTDSAVAQALHWMELEPLAERSCDMLSGGEWRRVLIAQGIAQEAKVLLLDEPTAFLDPPARHSTLQLLARLAHSMQLAVIVVLHDPLLAREFCDWTMLLSDGRVAACGPPEQTLNRPALSALYGGSDDWLHTLENNSC